MKKKIYLFVLVCLATFSNAQEKVSFRKGEVLLMWGWNRGFYTNSDIHFQGNGYDFRLYDVKATDRPTPFSFRYYFYPGNVTLPQTNVRIGYFYKDNTAIMLSLDHMKYVMKQDQTVDFSGNIDNPTYANMVEDGKIDLSDKKFLMFEHTDGLNYINIGWEKYGNIYQSNTKKVNISYSWGGGLGALLPRTNATLMGNERSDRFHLAGFGTDARASINAVLWKHLLIRLEGKVGYINMPDIKTTLNNQPDKASQDFSFAQIMLGVGYTFNMSKKK